MQFEVISGGLKQKGMAIENPSQSNVGQGGLNMAQFSPPQEQRDPSILEKAAIQALRGFEAPVELAQSGIDALMGLVGRPPIERLTSLSKGVQQDLGYSDEQLEPQGLIDRYTQKLAYQAPIAGLFGAGNVARTALSALPAALSGELGAPEIVQDLIQVGSDIGGAAALRSPMVAGKKGVETLKNILGETGPAPYKRLGSEQKKYYEAFKSKVPKYASESATPINSGIAKVHKMLGLETDLKRAELVKKALGTVEENVTKGFMNPSDALSLRTNLYRTTELNPSIQPYTQHLTQGINDFFGKYFVKNPEAVMDLSKADRLTEAKKVYSLFENIGGSLAGLMPFKGSQKIGKLAGNITLGGVEKFVKRYLSPSNPHFREMINSNVGNFIARNPGLTLKHLTESNRQDSRLMSAKKKLSQSPKKSVVSFEIIKRPSVG